MESGKEWVSMPRNSNEYMEGVKNFIKSSISSSSLNGKIKCPCKKCGLTIYLDPKEVHYHLQWIGFDKNYSRSKWVFHGEQLSPSPLSYDETFIDEDSDEETNEMHGLLHDAFGVSNFDATAKSSQNDKNQMNLGDEKYNKLMEDAKTEVYPGCQKFTTLSCIIRLYHMKCMYRWSDTSLNDLLKFLIELLPEGANLPRNIYHMKKIINDLGLGYTKIDACPNDCMLFWKERDKDEKCDVCDSSRWKNPVVGKKSGPAKILRHFPIIPRLKRLFMSSKTSQLMRWHEKGRSSDGKLRHPVDSLAWKSFDSKYPEFGKDARNVRLGLASDGFNPFGTMSISHSTWPVVLIVYNLPPWLCMKDSYFLMSLLISGPRAPGNDIDVYLQPLIEELKELWHIGVETFDACSNNTFMLHAALMWTINDFPAYGNLSGWTTKGKYACPHCHIDTCSRFLKRSRKMCYMGHRRFLDLNHPFRKNKAAFDGTLEKRKPPKVYSGIDLFNQASRVKVVLGKITKKLGGRKRNARGKGRKQKGIPCLGWKKESIFFSLPYWRNLLLRHNLDVMHVEKNVCDNLVGTLLEIEGKSKDSLNARFDLVDMNIRTHLHPRDEGDKIIIPPAPFSLDENGKVNFCKVLSSVRVPDGYASNVSRCVDVGARKIFGLKSHDCHIIMQQLLPLAIRKSLPRETSVLLIEFSNFFKELCSKDATFEDFQRLESRVTLTLCRLERTFLPAFFDVMVHLVIHLAYEAAIAGPIQYRWMYPIERYLSRLKSFVRNKARPEGSIAEAYIADECMNFCVRYLERVESREDRSNKSYDGGEDEIHKGLSIFSRVGRVLGSEDIIYLDHHQWIQAHEYVLSNCDQVAKYIEEYKRLLCLEHPLIHNVELERLHKLLFLKWWQINGEELSQEDDQQIREDLYWLSKGPSSLAKTVKKFCYNGFKFRTKDAELHSPTQNSGVAVDSEVGVIYYGILREILVLDYYERRNVVLFKCDWVDMARGIKEDSLGFTLVNFKHLWKTTEPYVLASQAFQVFYTPDPVEKDWSVVTRIKPRDAYDMCNEDLLLETSTYFDSQLHDPDVLENVIIDVDKIYVGENATNDNMNVESDTSEDLESDEDDFEDYDEENSEDLESDEDDFE